MLTTVFLCYFYYIYFASELSETMKSLVFESLVLEVSKGTKVFYLVVVYTPPSSNINEFFYVTRIAVGHD